MSSDLKRPLDTDGAANGGGPGALVVKRQRTEDSQLALKGSQSTKDVRFEPALRPWELWVTYGVKRTSKLDAPTMLLTGHSGEVLSCKFSPDGASIASGSHDKSILLWKTYGECENYSALAGHQNAVVELHWTVDGEKLLSASADCTVRAWDAAVGIQVKKMKEHSAFVNTCCPLRRGSPPLLASGSDDGTIKVWDLRSKRSVQTLTGAFPVIAVTFSDSGTELYTAGIEDAIKVWDLRKEQVSMVMPGHSDTVTGLALHPDGTHLLSNAMDNTLRVWDMRPFAPANRCVKVLAGHQHSFDHNMLRCSWSPDGSRVSAGSSDRMVNVWEVSSRMLQYKLPGHNGCVNEVVFHPEEPIVASCSSDQQLYLGELAA